MKRTVEEQRAFVYGFFYADGSFGEYHCKSSHKYSFAFHNNNHRYLILLREQSHDMGYDSRKKTLGSSTAYKFPSYISTAMVKKLRPKCYDVKRLKKISALVLQLKCYIRNT